MEENDPGGLHPGRAEHGLSVPLALLCPDRGTPRRALCLGHCTLVPDKPPAELSQHHHHHLPAAVSPQDPLTAPVPIPTDIASPGWHGQAGVPSDPHPQGEHTWACPWHCSLPHVATLCPLADAGLSSAWWPCCCPRGTSACALRSWSSSCPSQGPGQTSTCHSSEWGAWGVSVPSRDSSSPCSPQVQDKVRPLRTMTRAPARAQGLL